MTHTPFDTILIANRGEIACRIIRSAQAMGLRTVAVYSDADANAPHVKLADEAVHIGPSPVAESYLVIEKIIEAAEQTGAGAIHPGYGFLSENAGFAKACADAGLIFIGPPVQAIELMGDKRQAKIRMIAAGVPCVPGYEGDDQSDETLIREGNSVGFPLMVKAAAGGGGRGMRLVQDSAALPDAIKDARAEAESAFGAGDLILERAIFNARHVEIQVFADAHGNVVHLGERDCSVQRRHQKVLEEAPSPAVNEALRAEMGAAAVAAARDIDYVGAGTVEFLLGEDGAFYFLEMNTRLQVEHPVTEMTTGLDLVAMQIRAAQGDVLDIRQDDISFTGWAIEARLYAEDVAAGFLPASGDVDLFIEPSGAGIRVDAGVETGGAVSPFYDPMIAKIIAHGASREEARSRLVAAMKNTALFGATTNQRFLIDALEKPAFAQGDATTAFIGEHFDEASLADAPLDQAVAAAAALLFYTHAQAKAAASALAVAGDLMAWSSASKIATPYRFADGEEMHTVCVTPLGKDQFTVDHDGANIDASITRVSENKAQLVIDGRRMSLLFNIKDHGARIQLGHNGRSFDLTNLNAVFASAAEAAGAGAVTAPMHGLLVGVFVEAGQAVKKGDRLAILEAMKMQHELTAEVDGAVEAVYFEPGVQVPADALLLEISEEKD